MSMEDPGEPGARPATPAWTPAGAASHGDAPEQPRVPEGSGTDDLAFRRLDVPEEPQLPEGPAADDAAPDGEPDLEEFDWDSWEPSPGAEEGAPAEEVDWGDYPAGDPAESASWREKVIGESDWARDVLLGDLESLEPIPSSADSPAEALEDERELPSSLERPLPPSGRPWPPPGSVSHDVVHVRVAPWAPFTTGLALAVAMILVSAAILTQTGRLGLTLSVLTGQVPTTADAVVDAYLSAVSRGDAAKALSYLASKPANPILLTDAALRTSSAHSPLSVVSVTPGASTLSGTQQVAATYRLGDSEVSTVFTAAFTEGQWLIRDDPGRIGVGSLRAAGIPLYVDGQEVPDSIDSLPAFPGTYELATRSPYIEFASPATVVVRSPDEAPIIGAVQLQLTAAGRQAALDAVRAAVASCLTKKELQPRGCPQNIEPNRDEPVLTQTISYTSANDVLTVYESELRLSTVIVSYTAHWRIDAKVEVGGVPRDNSYSWDVSALWKVLLTSEHPTAELGS
ncbi:MAG TPA: hypothetical protein VFK68_02630 [Propionibacteriaceae bacterium]|nr:hypothetical protein [Propionibacteriaceae bacterium]